MKSANRRIGSAAAWAIGLAMVGTVAAVVAASVIANKSNDCTPNLDSSTFQSLPCIPVHHDYSTVYLIVWIASAVVGVIGSYALIAAAVKTGIQAAAEDKTRADSRTT